MAIAVTFFGELPESQKGIARGRESTTRQRTGGKKGKKRDFLGLPTLPGKGGRRGQLRKERKAHGRTFCFEQQSPETHLSPREKREIQNPRKGRGTPSPTFVSFRETVKGKEERARSISLSWGEKDRPTLGGEETQFPSHYLFPAKGT